MRIFFESYGKTSTEVFISKQSIVIKNGKMGNLAKLDVHAIFISNGFFKSAPPPVDKERKLNVNKTFRRLLMYVQFMSCLYGVSVA